MKKQNRMTMMSGNEAIVQGAMEAGVRFCTSYPGTPATEIATTLFRLADEHDIYVEWSVNEKVALEAAAAASLAGIPAICSMKSLGLNVASDFLLNVNITGTGCGGLVIVVCDDPRGYSSSNEQDSRFYAKAAQIPLLEPSTYQEAKDLTRYAFELSEKHEVPVIIRSTTRLSHSRGLVEPGVIPKRKRVTSKLPKALYNVPTPHLKHRDLLKKVEKIRKEFETTEFNTIQNIGENDLLVISSGICSMYVREALHLLETSKIGHFNMTTTYPMPTMILGPLLDRVNRVLFIEETDSFIEDEVRALSVNLKELPTFYGKRTEHVPNYGEMNTDTVMSAIRLVNETRPDEVVARHANGEELLVNRPLTFCAGCTHRNFYWAVRKVRKRIGGKLVVAGDIGCYSLGVFYDDAMNTMQAMGSGIGVAHGLSKLNRFGFDSKIIALAGDSTFFHACLPGLINARHKNADLTFVILDNETTAMTGFQIHPGSHNQIESHRRIEIEDIVKAVQPDYYSRGNADDIKGLTELLYSTINRKGLNVLLLDSICRLDEYASERILKDNGVSIDSDNCKGEKCKMCVAEFGCPAIIWDNTTGIPVILEAMCVRCGACIDVCPNDAITKE